MITDPLPTNPLIALLRLGIGRTPPSEARPPRPRPSNLEGWAGKRGPCFVQQRKKGVGGKGVGDHPEILENVSSNFVYISMFLMVWGGI